MLTVAGVASRMFSLSTSTLVDHVSLWFTTINTNIETFYFSIFTTIQHTSNFLNLTRSDQYNYEHFLLNFCWVESIPKKKKLWRRLLIGGEKKEKDFLNCKYKVTFQTGGCAEPTCAATCFIHFGFGHCLDNIKLLKCTFLVFYVCLFIVFACDLELYS